MQETATYEKTIYENQKDGIIIGLYRFSNKTKIITGTMLPSTPGVKYIFEGEWVNHPKYGLQFKAEYFSEDISTEDSIVRFLSSSLIKGIGAKTAQKIVDKFGSDTIDILDNNIERVLEVNRFPIKKFETFKESYIKQRKAKEVIMKLSKYGISIKDALKAYDTFGPRINSVLENTPYELSSIRGISFPTADRLGPPTLEYETSYERFICCANYVLFSNENNAFGKITGNPVSGSTCMDKDEFGKVMMYLLKREYISGKFICDTTIKMLKEKKLVSIKKNGRTYFANPGMYRMEHESARILSHIASTPVKTSVDVRKTLSKSQTQFCEKQIEAIENAFKHNVSLIVGMPGTGKTTIIKEIAKIYRKENPNNMMYFMAPTGRAAAKIKETMDIPKKNVKISTLHSVLKITEEFVFDDCTIVDREPLHDCLIVVDEMSMTDTRLFYQLMTALEDNCRIVFCGDDEQLQSVDSGAVLRDLINSGIICTTYLTQIFRQSEESPIYENLFKIRKGDTSLTYGNDFSFIENDSPEDDIINKYIEKVNEHGIENVMLITPFKKGDGGVVNLNNRIQELLNSSCEEVKGIYKFRTGDVVMQTVNDHDTGIMNGDIGKIIFIDSEEKILSVQFGTKIKEYDKNNLDELSLAYAYTIHKAQGSEAKCVITYCGLKHGGFLKRNVFYTAVTRASKEVIIFGEKEAFNKAIKTKDSSERITVLCELIRLYSNEFVDLRTANGNL